MVERLREEWERLGGRRQLLLLVGLVLAGALLCYQLALAPLFTAKARLRQTVAEQRELAVWMAHKAHEVQRLQKRLATAVPASRPLARINRLARQRGLAGGLKRLEPVGGGQVRAWFEGVVFDDLFTLIAELEQQGFQVAGLTAERRPAPGYVNARLTLTTPRRPPGNGSAPVAARPRT